VDPGVATTPTPEMCEDEQDCIDALGDMHEGYVCLDPEAA